MHHNNKKKKTDKNYTVLYVIAFLVILASSLALYYFSSPGIFISFDDDIYAYSVVQLSVLNSISWGESAFGFAIMTAPFYFLLDHSLESFTIVCFIADSITLFCLFFIGWKVYKTPVAGLFAMALYAFNPIVVTFALRYLPDPFITMTDAIGLAIALFAVKRRTYWMLSLSGIAVGAGLFFGNQAVFSILAFSFFAFMLIYINRNNVTKPKYNHIFLKSAAFLVMGFLVMSIIYFGQEAIMYGNPLHSINGESAYYSVRSSQNFPTYLYYFYLMFPVKYTNGFPYIGNSGILPYSNMSILILVFIASSLFVILKSDKKGRDQVLPYLLFIIVFYLVLSFIPEGLFSGNFTLGVQDVSRVFLPAIMFIAMGSALFITKINNRKLGLLIVFIVMAVYIAASTSSYVSIASIYHNSENYQWNVTLSVIKNFGSLNIRNYTLNENYSGEGYLLCMGLKYLPYNCAGISLPQHKINCNFENMLVVYQGTKPEYLCGKSLKGYNVTYYYNSTYNYSVYIKRQS
ncbi:MAG: hypothetical protein BK997_03345 [Candidatus Micrarchaeum sp. ARMAN-1]|jgi:4-amino-4-deoxy-L-arabinose transferase-like glycosyltransferase|nr:glycosyltransferase family 39 protein [Candidatus Marsarchaeota archaeon]OJI07268.1 MAG: hypothetical protein BK997_03345 [Candidatus Micrarchaeum sp. ARMAN-1]